MIVSTRNAVRFAIFARWRGKIFRTQYRSPKTHAIMGSTARKTTPVRAGDMDSIKKVTMAIFAIYTKSSTRKFVKRAAFAVCKKYPAG